MGQLMWTPHWLNHILMQRFHLYSDHIVELGLYILLYIACSLHIFTHVFHFVQAKAMSDNTNVVALGLFAYPVLQAADILLYK